MDASVFEGMMVRLIIGCVLVGAILGAGIYSGVHWLIHHKVSISVKAAGK